MAALKLFICAALLAVLTIQSANAGLIIRQITDLDTNKTLHFQGLDSLNTIEAYTNLLDDGQDAVVANDSYGTEQIELTPSVGVNKLYTMGHRIPGDRLVVHEGKAYRWSTPHSVRITLHYPTKGAGAMVSFILIAINQSNEGGRAYILNGGINQHYVTVVIEAPSITHIVLAANIYGK